MYREHLHLHLFSICCPWPPSESVWQITSRRSASSQCFLRYHVSWSRRASTGREGEQGDERPIPPGPTSVDSQNGNEQTYKRWCNCLHIINMVHRHWSRLGCSGDIYWWTTFQWLSLFIYLFSWLEIHCWLRLRHAWLASLISTLGQCLLFHHWPCVYFSTIGPMVTSLVRLTLERLSVYYTFFLLPGDASFAGACPRKILRLCI